MSRLITVDYGESLGELIRNCSQFCWIDTNITEHFSAPRTGVIVRELLAFHLPEAPLGGYHRRSSFIREEFSHGDEVIRYISRIYFYDGYRSGSAADFWEMLSFIRDLGEGAREWCPMVAFGQRWRGASGRRWVVLFHEDSDGLLLSLRNFGDLSWFEIDSHRLLVSLRK